MLSKKVEAALNQQIIYEAYAASSYLSMASWSEKEGYRGSTAFFYTQSEEEREHMLKLVHYINQTGGHARVAAIKEPPHVYKSLKDVFEIALQQEIDVSKSINKLVELSFDTGDFATFNFLQWYVAEQHEEEHLFTSILDLLKIAGSEGKNLLIADNEIPKLRGEEAKS